MTMTTQPNLLQVDIWVRRAGPNYQEGLKNMRITGDELGLPIHLYGPETHITAVVPLALGLRDPTGYPGDFYSHQRHHVTYDNSM